jgi:hypothetical protein
VALAPFPAREIQELLVNIEDKPARYVVQQNKFWAIEGRKLMVFF